MVQIIRLELFFLNDFNFLLFDNTSLIPPPSPLPLGTTFTLSASVYSTF